MARTYVPAKPLSPVRTAKQAAKKTAALPRAPPHKPRPDSPIHLLPTHLSKVGRVWWNRFIGKTFLEWKKTRGNKDGAKGQLRKIFVDEWWADNFPDVDVSDEDKIWYFDRTDLGSQIYSYVNNSSVRGSTGRELTTPATAIKQRAYAHDDWRREHPDIFKEAVAAWKEEHEGQAPNLGEARALSSELFKELPEDEQMRWREVAKTRLAAMRAQARIADPNDRADYINDFKKTLERLTAEANAVAGIQLCAMIVYEKSDGKLKIERHISKGLQDFGKSQAFGHSMIAMQKWLEETGGKDVESGAPQPCVYPVYSNNEYPGIPNYVGWKLEQLQGLMRGYVGGVNRFQGSVLRVAWTEIRKDPGRFIHPSRLPDGLLSEFGDPSTLSMRTVVPLVDYFLGCHTGSVPEDKRFQLRLVFAGSHPIHPDDSQEASRKLVNFGGKSGWMLKFKRTVTVCHHPKGMDYTKAAHAYAYFVAHGMETPRAICAAPARWVELPVAGPSIPNRIFSDTEYERYSSLASLLPESSGSRIMSILDATNEHQRHIPASDSKGVYGLDQAPPLAIPPDPNSRNPPKSMWLAPCYYQSSRIAPREGTVGYFEEWQEKLLESDILYHEPSGTLSGGDNGVVCVVRPLVDLILNFAAVRGDFKPPEDPPNGYDLSRLPVNEWSRLLGWTDKWINTINASTEILRATSTERQKGLDNLPLQPDTPIREEPAPSGSHSSPSPTPEPQQPALPKEPRNRKGKNRAHDDEESMAGSEESEESEERDFEALDKTPQDDDDDDDDDDWGQWDPTGLGAGNSSAGTGTEPLMGEEDEDEQYDPLGLRVRYGFTDENTYEQGISESNGMFKTDLTASSTDIPRLVIPNTPSHPSGIWAPSAGVFGVFTKLPPYLPARFHSPHALVKQLRAHKNACADTLKKLDAYLTAHPQISQSILDDALAQTQVYPTHVRPLYALLFTRQAVWKRAETIAKVVHGHAHRMALVMHEGTELFLTAEQVIQQCEFPDPDMTEFTVAEAVTDSKCGLIELRWTYKEMKAFQALATERYNALQANWMGSGGSMDAASLAQVVQGLTDWIEKTAQLTVQLQSKQESSWVKYTSKPFPREKLTSGSLYWFGCPTVEEVPAGVHDAWTYVKALPAGTTALPTAKSPLGAHNCDSLDEPPAVAPIAPSSAPSVDRTALPIGPTSSLVSPAATPPASNSATLSGDASLTITTPTSLTAQDLPPPGPAADLTGGGGTSRASSTAPPLGSPSDSLPPGPPLKKPVQEKSAPKRKSGPGAEDNNTRRVSARISAANAPIEPVAPRTRASALKATTVTKGAGSKGRGTVANAKSAVGARKVSMTKRTRK